MNPLLFWRLSLAAAVMFLPGVAGATELLSVNLAGTQSCNAGLGEPLCINADGRFVAFHSSATNLVMPDTNGLVDVFVRDCVLRSNVWSTVGSIGPVGGPVSTPLQFTPDGRFLLFSSPAINLAPGATNPGLTQLFRRDLWSNETALVSMAYDGSNAATKSVSATGLNVRSSQSCMTPDGRFILYTSAATNLIAGVGTGTLTYAYLRDMLGASNELVTMSPVTVGLDASVASCLMSTNARYFAFYTSASNVVAGLVKTNNTTQVYWRDRLAGTNALVSVDVNGAFTKDASTLMSLSREGRYVCFNCLSTNVVAGQNDSNGTQDLFIRDMFAGETWLVSRATNGNTTSSRVSGGPFSANGEWMLLSPVASDLVAGASAFSGSSRDVYLHNVAARTNLLVTRSVAGVTGANGYCTDGFATLSASGRFVVFDTASTNLLPGGTTGVNRLLLRDCAANKTLAVMPGGYTTLPYNYGHYVISEDEAFVYFLASANYDPTVTDNNSAPDLFRARLLPAQLQPPAPGGPIQGQGLALGTYILQTSSNLLNWSDAVTNIADSNGVFSVSDPQPPGPQRYFRLKTP